MNNTALSLDGLSSGYKQAVVVRDCSLAINKGEIVAVVGKNGMGKTTLLKAIMGYLPKYAGSVAIKNQVVNSYRPHQVARHGVAYVPQEGAIFPELTVEENILLALPKSRRWNEAKQDVNRYFPFLLERLRQKAGTLSGGEQKMLLLARALTCNADVMLIDEITEGIQPSIVTKIISILKEERERLGRSILIVEQNIPFAVSVADRYIVLNNGEVTETGRTDEPDVQSKVSSYISI